MESPNENHPTPVPAASTSARPVHAMASEAPRFNSEIGPDPRKFLSMIHLTPVMEADGGLRFDFNHGYRVWLPEGMPPCLLRVYDLERQTPLEEWELDPLKMVVGERKYFIRYRFEVIERATGKVLVRHDYDCVGQKVMIVIPDGGLGDNLAWLPYAEAFRVEHRADVTCVCGEWLIRLVKEQYPELSCGEASFGNEGYGEAFCQGMVDRIPGTERQGSGSDNRYC